MKLAGNYIYHKGIMGLRGEVNGIGDNGGLGEGQINYGTKNMPTLIKNGLVG